MGDLRYATDSFNFFITFQRKSFMKFTGIMFDMSEGLLTAKTAEYTDLIMCLQETNTFSKSSLQTQGKSVKNF